MLYVIATPEPVPDVSGLRFESFDALGKALARVKFETGPAFLFECDDEAAAQSCHHADPTSDAVIGRRFLARAW